MTNAILSFLGAVVIMVIAFSAVMLIISILIPDSSTLPYTTVYDWPYKEGCIEVREQYTRDTIQNGVYCLIEVTP